MQSAITIKPETRRQVYWTKVWIDTFASVGGVHAFVPGNASDNA
ncbi:MAG TPA: hypothetical protein VK641_11780 [Terriglobales bacterium]|jgi:hypothetical protein|nr:hypothetical protein [Terriglobales bacterium]